MKVKTYPSLDALKAFAAVGILLMHIRANGNYEIEGYLYNTVIASLTDFVFLFMTISAFGLCCGYFERMVNREIDISDFYKRRFQKILPFFALMTVFDIVVSPSVDALKEGFANVTLMFGFLPDPGSISVIGVGWFIGLTFVFYLCFPFFCFLLSSKPRAWAAFAISVLWNLLGSTYFSLSRSNILYSGCFFMAGGLLYLYRDKVSKVPAMVWCILAGCSAVLYYAANRNGLAALLLSALLVMVGITSRNKLLKTPAVVFLSSVSLEIYLSHMAIFRVLEKLHLTRLLGSGWGSYCITVILTLAGAVVFSLVAKELLNQMEKLWTNVSLRKEC